jgi:hypothetical protein
MIPWCLHTNIVTVRDDASQRRSIPHRNQGGSIRGVHSFSLQGNTTTGIVFIVERDNEAQQFEWSRDYSGLTKAIADVRVNEGVLGVLDEPDEPGETITGCSRPDCVKDRYRLVPEQVSHRVTVLLGLVLIIYIDLWWKDVTSKPSSSKPVETGAASPSQCAEDDRTRCPCRILTLIGMDNLVHRLHNAGLCPALVVTLLCVDTLMVRTERRGRKSQFGTTALSGGGLLCQ